MKNRKQIEWSENKVLSSKLNKARLSGLFIFAVLVSFIGGMLFSGTITASQLLDFGGVASVITATIVGFTSVDGDPTNDKKAGKQVKAKMWFIEKDQHDDTQSFPARIGRQIGNIPLKAGEYWHYIDTVLDSPEPKWSGQMGDVAATIKNELTFTLGGMGNDVFDLLEKGIGRGFYIVWQVCATGDFFLSGNACKPARMTKFEGGAGKDQTATTVTFDVECGEVWSKYIGNTPSAPAATVAANATTIGLTSAQQYQTTSGTASAASITAFSGVTDTDVNRIVTVIGSGGTYPSTIAAAATFFLLIAGETWAANTGKQISFKIFKDGASSYKFVEIPGSRT